MMKLGSHEKNCSIEYDLVQQFSPDSQTNLRYDTVLLDTPINARIFRKNFFFLYYGKYLL